MAHFHQRDQYNADVIHKAETIHIHQWPVWWIIGILIVVVLVAGASGGYVLVSSLGSASQVTITATPKGPIYAVKNTSETLPDGVYFRHSMQVVPGQPTPTPTLNFGVFMNDKIRVVCWVWGDAMPEDGDRVWYYAFSITRPTVAGRVDKGWLNAHYVDDGMAINHPAPGIPQCHTPLPVGG